MNHCFALVFLFFSSFFCFPYFSLVLSLFPYFFTCFLYFSYVSSCFPFFFFHFSSCSFFTIFPFFHFFHFSFLQFFLCIFPFFFLHFFIFFFSSFFFSGAQHQIFFWPQLPRDFQSKLFCKRSFFWPVSGRERIPLWALFSPFVPPYFSSLFSFFLFFSRMCAIGCSGNLGGWDVCQPRCASVEHLPEP